MRSSVIVEVDRNGYCSYDITEISEHLVFKQLVLHCVVDSLCLGIVFRIARLGHADTYAMLPQGIYILSTCILTATIGVMD